MTSLPPMVPTELEGLDRLVKLLGFRAKGVRFSKSVEAELLGLCGASPTPEDAARWKRELRQIRRELVNDTSDDIEDIAS
jgi:hypothetical protein